MAYTELQDTINWAETFYEYSPTSAGTNSEPAVSIATMVRNTILNAPFVWPFNRNEFAITALTAGTQNYTWAITDFAYLEKVSLTTADSTYAYELKDVYNTRILGIDNGSTSQAQPEALAVVSYIPGTSVNVRFLSSPDQAYTGTATYQKLPVPFAALTDSWSPIPSHFMEIYNNLFLAEALAMVDDARSQVYRQRGVAALLSKAEGLSEMQVNAFLAQYLHRDSMQTLASQLRVQQGSQARGM